MSADPSTAAPVDPTTPADPSNSDVLAALRDLTAEIAKSNAAAASSPAVPADIPTAAAVPDIPADAQAPIDVTTVPDIPAATDTAAPAPSVKVGDLVEHSYRDDYAGAGGEDVTDSGLVLQLVDVDLGDGTTASRARVAWLRDISGPLDTGALTVVET